MNAPEPSKIASDVPAQPVRTPAVLSGAELLAWK